MAIPLDDGSNIPPGMQTDLVVKRTFYYNLEYYESKKFSEKCLK